MDSKAQKKKPNVPNANALSYNPSKRKQQPQNTEQPNRKKRRVFHSQDARVIAAQTTGKAFGDGEVDVDKFVRARQFEIQALEDGMKRAKKQLSTRAFQNVPRELRRRTASHNVKRVPKRLRARAAKEMQEDNTPTVSSKTRKPDSHMRLRLETVKRLKKLGSKRKLGASNIKESSTENSDKVTARTPRVKKNVLAKPPIPKAKFRKRQIHKSWLPTHIFHAKRAHMTPPKEPLWRMTIPLSPNQKSYRSIHRATNLRGAVAWDLSYMSTIGIYGVQSKIISMLKDLQLQSGDGLECAENPSSKWIRGTRTFHGWVFEKSGVTNSAIAPITVIWAAQASTQVNGQHEKSFNAAKVAREEKKDVRTVFIRVHPSAFLQIWEEILELSRLEYKSLRVEDLRFEIGSIEVSGPAAAEALIGTLWPIKHDGEGISEGPAELWPLLKNVADPAHLPGNALLGFDVSDPRLHHPPDKDTSSSDAQTQQQLLRVLTEWPVDKTQPPPKIFNRAARYAAARQLPSQKAINRRKALAQPGTYPDAKASDPHIPLLLYTNLRGTNVDGGWTLLLPWKCVLPVWYSIMHFPLSSGGNARFGGLDQKRQVLFESGSPWFPGDFPGTKAGNAWESKQREKRREEWEKRPKGKRVEWESVDLGDDRVGEVGIGWACDWEYLSNGSNIQDENPAAQFYHLPYSNALAMLKSRFKNAGLKSGSTPLMTVRITLLSRGAPTACARVYRLPLDDSKLRQRWLSLQPSERRGNGIKKRNPAPLAKDASEDMRRMHLAASILDPTDAPRIGDKDYPVVPNENDLVGFVTTGSFNLSEGKGTAIASIALEKVMEMNGSGKFDAIARKEQHLCIVREAGLAHGRLARWELV